MLAMDIVRQRLAEILRDVETEAALKTIRYIEDVKSWEIEVEVKSGGVRTGRIPEEWVDQDEEEKLHNRLYGLLLKERPEKR